MFDYSKTFSRVFSCLGISVASLFVAACAATKGTEKNPEAWVEQAEEKLVKSWGPPAQVYQSGVRRFLVYLSNGSACRYTFEIKDDKIVNWNAKGNDCRGN